MTSLDSLRTYSTELFDLQSIIALLQWDQEVLMPRGAVHDRANQVALLTALFHSKQTSAELNTLIEKAAVEISEDSSDADRALVRVMKRSYEQATKLPQEFVVEFSKLTSESVHAWVEARQKSDFNHFKPYLEKVVSMCRQQADMLGYAEHPYDALLDIYEEGLTTADVARVFSELKQPLIELLPKASQKWAAELILKDHISAYEQEKLCKVIAAYIGYDFNRGRLDTAPHPFMTALGHDDRRITTRYAPDDIWSIFGVMHECGHAMYEQGISSSIARTALDTGVSLGMHESQSRMWENMIGRSKAFWDGAFSTVQEMFPKQYGAMSVEEFYRYCNHVKAGLIRVEADEVSYNLHILIRFEIEKALIEGSLEVKDVCEVWNAKYKEYLGVAVPDDAHGVLQDIHWSHGTLGYFPTYTLGNLASAQIWGAYTRYDSGYEETLRTGNLKKVREWLTEHMYQYGSIYQPKELMQRITGEEMQSKYLIQYLREKYL
jgi:carboxypeptidase Taq